MPTLGAPLDLAKYEAKNFRAHQLGTNPSSPVTGQLYYNTGDNTLYWWDGTTWNSARGVVPDATASVKGVIQLAGDLAAGTAAAPVVLKSTGNFTVGNQLIIPTAGTAGGLYITAVDTNLYRFTAGVLKSDAQFRVPVTGSTAVTTPNPPGLRIGDSWASHLQHTWGGQASLAISHNSYYEPGATQPKYTSNHATFGHRMIMFNYTSGIVFYAGGEAATQDTAFTPTQRMLLTNAGQLQLNVAGSTGGLLIGDATLWRNGASVLQTDGGLIVVGTLTVNGRLRTPALAAAPSAPVAGEMYYDTGTNTLYWYNGTAWMSSAASGAAGGDLGGTYPNPTVTNLHLAAATAINQRLTAVTDPTGAQDAATKNYVDTQSGSVLWHAPVRVATTSSPTLSGTQTIDGVALSAGDRILVKDGIPAYVNGIYIVQSGAWTRAPDMNAWSQVCGAMVDVLGGTTYGNTVWQCTNSNLGGALGSSNINWQVMPSAIVLGAPGTGYVMPANARLDQIATSNAATAPVSLNNQKITNLLDPTGAQDGATKNYVDTVATGLDAKQSVKAATTANITLSAAQTVDGVALVAGDRCLVKNQTTTAQNGIYTVQTGAWTRVTDMDIWNEVPGAFCWVEQGTVNGDSGWACTADQGGTLETTAITWTQFAGSATFTAGNGLTKTGTVFSANVDGVSLDLGGPGASIEIAAGGVTGGKIAAGAINLAGSTVTGTLGVAAGGTGQVTAKGARETGLGAAGYYNNNATHGAGTTIAITQATHGLRASRAIHVQVQDNSTGNVELPDISVAANGDVTITYGAAVTANTKLVTLVG